ncbi:MAG: hypothetical protein ACI82N_000578 [Maricaulis sp.]|jgi:hypothetical protein
MNARPDFDGAGQDEVRAWGGARLNRPFPDETPDRHTPVIFTDNQSLKECRS